MFKTKPPTTKNNKYQIHTFTIGAIYIKLSSIRLFTVLANVFLKSVELIICFNVVKNFIIIIIVTLVVGKLPVDWSSHRDVSAVSRLSVEQSIIHTSLKRFTNQCLSNRPLKQLTVLDDTTSSGRLFHKLTTLTPKKFARIE